MKKNTVQIIGMPMDFGQQRRGVDMGPSAIRYAGLQKKLSRMGYTVLDKGNVDIPVPEEILSEKDSKAKHLQIISQANSSLADSVESALKDDNFPIILGGDHSIAAGSVVGVRRVEEVGLIWVDAHADYNTPKTSPSGNLHGMPLSSLLGKEPQDIAPYGTLSKLKHSEVVLLGIRSLDFEEKKSLMKDGLTIFTMRDIDELGIAEVTRQILLHFKRVGLEKLHISFDMDVLDPGVAPGVGTPVPGGLTYREAHLLMEILAENNRVTSLDIVEINPILDVKNSTAEMAVGLIASLLGQRIL